MIIIFYKHTRRSINACTTLHTIKIKIFKYCTKNGTSLSCTTKTVMC